MWRKALRTISLLIGCGILAGCMKANAQQAAAAMAEVGKPMSAFYQSTDYQAHDQNFAIAQDKTGLMYFANFAGVLEYDGVSWNTIQTQRVTRVSALAVDGRGDILVGAGGEFGYLAYDSTGVHRFVSLSSKLREKFGQVIQIVPVKTGSWFVTAQDNFFWNNKTVTAFHHNLNIQSAFPWNGRLVVFGKDKGVLVLEGHKVSKVDQGQDVPVLLDLVAAVPLSNEAVLLLTSGQGIFRLANNRIQSVAGNADGLLIRRKVTAAARLSDGSIAISLGESGMLVISADGDLLYPVPADKDVEDSQASSMFTDRDHHLWLTFNNGIARFDLPSPISIFGPAEGLKGSVTALRRFKGKMVVGTLSGLYVIENNRVIRINNFPGSCLGLDEANGSLYIASNKGLYHWSGGQSVERVTDDFSLTVCASAGGNALFVGLQDGLAILTKTGNGWQPARVRPVHEQIVGITEFPTGIFWLETLSNGILKFDRATGTIKRFSAAQGILSPLYNKLALYGAKLIVSNKDGLFEYEAGSDRFTRANWLSTQRTWFDRLRGDSQGNVWTTRGDRKSVTFFRKKTSGGFDLEEKSLSTIAQVPFQVIYADAGSVAWLGGDQGLYRVNMQSVQRYVYKYPVLIRKVMVIGMGTQDGAIPFSRDSLVPRTHLSPKQNNIVFEFALPSYNSNQQVRYQYQLENYDKDWSDWGPLTRKEYNGLPSGNYVFKVRARDIHDNVSQDAQFPFTIQTPWFRQWYMLALYVILFSVMIYYAVRWRLRSIIKEKRELENRVRERTEEVVNQKEELEQQSEELSETNDQLERIDEFVKSINGEVNTGKLFQLVLNKLCEFQNVDGASALVYNKAFAHYQFIALAGSVENAVVDEVRLTAEEAQQRYVDRAEEVFEDIFLKNSFRFQNANASVNELFSPQSLITILIRVEGEVKSYITLENMARENAFTGRDFNMVRNLKEHLIGAYIKTTILENLESTLTNLKSAQDELIRQERLASVGSLTKGIVDRILNPLNYINNFSQSSGKLLTEITEVTDKHQDVLSEDEKDDLESGFDMLRKNLEKIYEHGNSTTRIVKDMQKLLKGKSTEFFVVELNPFLESKARTAVQEVLNEYKDSKVKLSLNLDVKPLKVSVLPFEFAQVLTNLISNACYALFEKSKIDKVFVPEIVVSSESMDGIVSIRLRDNGKGIPLKETEQLFNPFFTTKPTSKGTGLGLYMSKDIIEFHKGRISVRSREGEFTEVEIILPVVR